MDDPFSRKALRPALCPSADFDSGELLTGGPPAAPVRFKQGYKRGKAGPILWTDSVTGILLSNPVKEAMTQEGLTGWSTYPVELGDIEADTGYSGLRVLGRSGPRDWSRGEWVRTGDEPRPSLRGFYFEETSWDGSDVFTPAGSLWVVVTERARIRLARHVGTSCHFDRLSEHLTSEIVVRHSTRNAPEYVD
jgi:hypothetical protein